MKLKIPENAINTEFKAFPGNCSQRLNGVEPSHMPPEGIALSTELQTHSGLFKQISDFLEQP